MSALRHLVLLGLLVGASCTGPRPGRLQDLHTTELASEVALVLHARPVPSIDGTIPGHGRGEFILDTGARHTILDRGRAQRLGLPLFDYDEPLRVTRGGIAAGSIAQHTKVARLELGGMSVLDLEPPVAELRHVQRRLAGLVGQDVLRTLGVVFDGPAREVRFLQPQGVAAALEELAATGVELEQLPIEWWNGVPTIEVHCGSDVHARMVLDTGASMTSLPRATVETLGLRRMGSTQRAHIGGTERAPVYRCNELRLGRFAAPAWVDEHQGERGLLGYDVLRRFVVVLDGPAGLLWIGRRAGTR